LTETNVLNTKSSLFHSMLHRAQFNIRRICTNSFQCVSVCWWYFSGFMRGFASCRCHVSTRSFSRGQATKLSAVC